MATTSTTAVAYADLRLELTIHGARDLVAKDRKVFKRGGTSDPYAIVKFVDGTAGRGGGVDVARTTAAKETLAPTWEHRVSQAFGAAAAQRIMGRPGPRPFYRILLFDKDKCSSDDPMGEARLPVPAASISRQWIKVEKGSGSTYCKDATGEVCLSLRVAPTEMPRVVRGNVIPLRVAPGHSKIVVGLGWDLQAGAPVDLDVSCAAVGRSGQFLMQETVYYGQLKNSNGSVTHSGDEREGDEDLGGSGDDEQITLDLNRIPPVVGAYVVLVTLATPGATFSRVNSARVRAFDARTGAGYFCFELLPQHLVDATALFVLRVARDATGGWSLGTIRDTDRRARDFGTLIPEIRGYCRDLAPGVVVDPHERVAVASKGTAVRLRDYAPVRNILPHSLTLGLAWDVTGGVNIDLDASAVCLDENLRKIDQVYFNHLHSNDGAIHHSGDEREGDEAGDDEKIKMSLASVDPRVEHIVFVINSYSGQELDDVSRASCHLFDPQTRKDLVSYVLSNNKGLDGHVALLMADVYKSGPDRDWYLRVLSVPSQGKTATRSVEHIQRVLRQLPAPEVNIVPEPEVILNEMPSVVPVEEEISFAPLDQEIAYTPNR